MRWLFGIPCFVLLVNQFISNLTVVHQDKSGSMNEDPPDYPDLSQSHNKIPKVHHSTKVANSSTASAASLSSTLARNVKEIDNTSVHDRQDSNLIPTESEDLKEQPQHNGNTDNIEDADNSTSLSPSDDSALWSIETSYLYTLPEYGQIRRWGCRLSTVPFIFVHIGKTGGGNVRARLAASSLNYTKVEFRHQDFSYYPLKKQQQHLPRQNRRYRRRRRFKYDDEDRAQFCHSGFHMFKPQALRTHFRRSLQCNATTPLGQALACPELFHHAYDPNRTRIMDRYQPPNIQQMIDKVKSGNADNETTILYHNRNALRYRRHPCFLPPSSDHAHVVFVGHHNLGSEMHWLPAGVLLDWWNTYWAINSTTTALALSNAVEQRHDVDASNAVDRVAQRILSLFADYDLSYFPNHYGDDGADHQPTRNGWCQGRPRPMFAYEDTSDFYHSCSEKLYQPMDDLVKEAVRQRMIPTLSNRAGPTATINTTAARATIITPKSTNKKLAMAGYWSTIYASLPVLRVTILRDPFSWLCSKFFWHKVDELFNVTCDDAATAIKGNWLSIQNKKQPRGWARRMALLYLEQICGDDCVVRSYYSTESVLEELERQATANLRQAFAVVGILPDLDDFYDLLNRRMDYLNTSLNPHVEGMRHGSFSANPDETGRCKEQYLKNQTFRELMLQAPEVAALQRVYEVGVAVNQFQRKELDQC